MPGVIKVKDAPPLIEYVLPAGREIVELAFTLSKTRVAGYQEVGNVIVAGDAGVNKKYPKKGIGLVAGKAILVVIV
jgi:hypothetical protein